MIRYVYDNEEYVFNPARQKAHMALKKSLSELCGKDGVTEIAFKRQWLKNMESLGGIFADGWYCPPPLGIAVLFGDRVTFDSLRNEYNWSNDTVMDWNRDMFYAYASPVDKETGTIGDTSVTIYFGENRKILDHIKNCHDAVMDVFENLEKVSKGRELFRMSQEIFEKHGLKSDVISRTDNMPVNLGHTFPSLDGASEKESLSDEDKLIISKARKFVNDTGEWEFTDGLQFTVEPQLLSLEDPEMPQITQHYVVMANRDGFTVCNDIDEILKAYGQI
ncbi:MAG: hypothetical protein IKE27_03940 [Oscillospiraceae bacterium]|nr:hypothetical protein [Oscillospiraceae bacterium]